MGLFGTRPTQEADFLAIVQDRIRPEEFERLGTEGGFTPPNDFPIEAVIEVLRNRRFPRAEPFEYGYAIYECDFERLRGYSPWMKVYLASLYLYCEKRKQWATIESNYYYLVIETAIAEPHKDTELLAAFLSFVEWLYDGVAADEGYEDHYCLLGWALLRRISNSTDHPCFRQVMDLLLAKHYSREDLGRLTGYSRSIEAWFALHERIPCDPALRADFERIIRGEPT